MKSILVFLLIVIIAVETLAQYLLESAYRRYNDFVLIAGVTTYGLVGLLYYYILRTGDELAMANALWNAGTGITVTVIGTLLFKQKLKTIQIVGLILSIIGFSLLQ